MAPTGPENISAGRSVNPTARGSFKRIAKAHGITHGYCSDEVAERIFRDTLSEWGVTSSDEATRSDILGGLAEVLWASTSVETDYSTVTFEVNGTTLCVATLVNRCNTAVSSLNALRTWIRSFRRAEIALRIHDFLDTPENISQRQEAAASYGADIANSRFCFDMADALLISGRDYNGTERRIIEDLKIYATSRSQNNAQSRGLSQASQDTSGGHVGGRPAQERGTPSGINVAPPTVRGGFTPVR